MTLVRNDCIVKQDYQRSDTYGVRAVIPRPKLQHAN